MRQPFLNENAEEQRQNPSSFPCMSHHWITKRARLRNFELDREQCARLGIFQPLRLTDEVRDAIIDRIRIKPEFRCFQQFFRYKDFLICRLSPKKESEDDFGFLVQKNKKQGMKFEFGDLRIMFEVVPCDKVSICGQQIQIDQAIIREDEPSLAAER